MWRGWRARTSRSCRSRPGDLDIPVVGQLPAAEPSARRRFRAESGEDGTLPGSVQEWGLWKLDSRSPPTMSLPSLTQSNRRGYRTRMPSGVGGVALRGVPYPIKISSATLTECRNYAARILCGWRQPRLLDNQVVWVRGLRNCPESRF